MPLPRIALTVGEPAGIGPDISLKLAGLPLDAALVALGDPKVLEQRALQLGLDVTIEEAPGNRWPAHTPGRLFVKPHHYPEAVVPGQLEIKNQACVLQTIRSATLGCLGGDYDAMVTAPVNKAVINQAGFTFSGHTEFIAGLCACDQPVMVLDNGHLRVGLVTTHIPLSKVSSLITAERLQEVIVTLERELRSRYSIQHPELLVCGLNPHAGEQGELGQEEIVTIIPTLEALRSRGLRLVGPVPADTAFTPGALENIDMVVAMYHDQGLPVLKAQGFGNAVNVTFGLPIIRTSVDHGTALELAASGKASADSLYQAVIEAIRLANLGQASAAVQNG